MRKVLTFLTLSFLVFSANVSADEEMPKALAEEEAPLAYFPVNNGWTGEVFLLYEKEDGVYTVVHEIYGAGVPVISRDTYRAKKVGDTKLAFRIDKLTFTIRMDEGQAPKLFLNGYQLATQ